MTKKYEMANLDKDGDWNDCGEFSTLDAAIAQAKAHAENPRLSLHRDTEGSAVFGITRDPRSGHYETQIVIHGDGSHTIS